MKISVITVTKNNKSGLMHAIESVKSQSHDDVEHVVVDGASSDGTIELLVNNEADSKIHSGYDFKWSSEPDSGIYDAINKGIKIAAGDVIGLLHSDDFYTDRDVLRKYADMFRNVRYEAVYSDLVYARSKPDPMQSSNHTTIQSYSHTTIQSYSHTSQHPYTYAILRRWTAQKHQFTDEVQRNRAILKGWMPPHPTLFLRREVFEKYGLYRTDMKIAADYEMILRLFYKHNITSGYLPFTTYCMMTGGASNKNAGNIILKSKEDFIGMKAHGLRFPAFTLFCKNLRKIPQFF